ncbi:DUF2207 domain-containing protein [Salisediminibacterium halotolerans]|uniref:DUF2207 domain-containing protein n=1 Tax=Salisediminibacterium halotolerans TaxID=517425 RepID=UPI000F28C498|nr:DUF2207 domain-containing protein [Salisediminibacterium halotolerans]RLJ74103.1 putative membrane protein DUF2207 [Actinophytocola xinjiangensis]RPE87803.1 putative membrane protein DUF2207 [Salisediminibacterium halotolerans]TWG34940.1 putative membrane protein DUF2207 [Salisediminibacterium halotolerans]GEL08226.1 hypothetical protein SHA02_16420 [Salisediminibacterium halotolerans]
MNNVLFLSLFIVLAAVSLIFLFIDRKKRTPKTGSAAETERVFPPVLAKLVDGTGVVSRHMTAGLLSFVQDNYASLNREGTEGMPVFTAVEEPPGASAGYLYRWLFYKIGENGRFEPDRLFMYTSAEHGKRAFFEDLNEWETIMEKELTDTGLLRPFTPLRKTIVMLQLFMMVFGSALLIVSPWTGLLYLMFALAAFITVFASSPRSAEGERLFQFGKAYKQKLAGTDEPLNAADPEALTDHFVYAVAFGVWRSYTRQFPVREASEVALVSNQLPLYYYAAPGTAVLSLEGIRMIDETEASFSFAAGDGESPAVWEDSDSSLPLE